jgi:hypothetical protein
MRWSSREPLVLMGKPSSDPSIVGRLDRLAAGLDAFAALGRAVRSHTAPSLLSQAFACRRTLAGAVPP